MSLDFGLGMSLLQLEVEMYQMYLELALEQVVVQCMVIFSTFG